MLMSCLAIQKKDIYTTGLFSMALFMLINTPTQQYSGFNGGGLTRTLETLHVYACDGDYVRVACPLKTVIIIQYAKYGRSVPSSLMCNAGTHKPTFTDVVSHGDTPLIEDTNCIAIRSLEVMLDLCEDRPSCAVKASPETFTQDPCMGTSKYIEAHYKCRPNEFDRETACEGQELKISCGRGDRIAVYSAMYGRTPNGTDKCRANKQGFIDCQAPGAFSEVSARCQGRRKCVVQANESVFGDPCASGVNKYLTVSYACVPRKILKQLPHQTTNKKKKKKKKKKGKRKGKEPDNVTDATTRTDMSGAITQSSDHHIHQSPPPEVLESFEQQTVTQVLPVPGRGSLSNESRSFLETEDVTSESQDMATIQSESIWPEDNVVTTAPVMPDATEGDHNHRLELARSGSDAGESHASGIGDTTESVHSSSYNHNRNKDMSAEYNTNYNNDNEENQNIDFNKNHNEYKGTGKTNEHIAKNIGSSHIGPINNKGHVGHIRENPDAKPTDSPQSLDISLNSASRISAKGQGSKSVVHPTRSPTSKSIKGKMVPESPYVTERNLTVLCMNYTRPNVRWGGMKRPKDERTIGFLRDWFSAMYFLQMHQEKAWLYFTLGICFGIIVMLVIVLIKVCFNFRRNIRARLDVSEPTHRNAHTTNHSSLDAPMLEHSDSIDQIEVVRFSPRSTLRSHRSNSHHRDLVNYYG